MEKSKHNLKQRTAVCARTQASVLGQPEGKIIYLCAVCTCEKQGSTRLFFRGKGPAQRRAKIDGQLTQSALMQKREERLHSWSLVASHNPNSGAGFDEQEEDASCVKV